MTIKEHLEWQLGVANEEADRKLIKSIIKDLEVLSILKKYFHFDIVDYGSEKFIKAVGKEDYEKGYEVEVTADNDISEDDYTVIKEWLKDE